MGAATSHFFPGGGGWGRGSEPLAQTILAICPNFYETVKDKQGSYYKLTWAYIRNEYILSYQSITSP